MYFNILNELIYYYLSFLPSYIAVSILYFLYNCNNANLLIYKNNK